MTETTTREQGLIMHLANKSTIPRHRLGIIRRRCTRGLIAGAPWRRGRAAVPFGSGSAAGGLEAAPDVPGSRHPGTRAQHLRVVALKNAFYGVTTTGGKGNCYPDGCGTVFEVTVDGKEKVLHRFDPRRKDGVLLYSGLVSVGGLLYGTTVSGGKSGDDGGTVFKMTTSGTETILHYFGLYDKNGTFPDGSVTPIGNVLYGTTSYGGKATPKNKFGYGSVFKLSL